MPDATYVYCVIKSVVSPGATAPRRAAGRSEGGLGKPAPPRMPKAGAPRVLDAGDGYRVVVASAPLPAYSAGEIEAKLGDLEWVGACGAAHEAVVERASRLGTVVPMKLFTLFSSDERALAHVRGMKRSLERVTARIAGCDEWGLRVLWDEAGAAKAKAKTKGARRAGAAAEPPVTGAGFLQRKKEQADAHRKLAASAKTEADDLFASLEGASKRAVRRAAPSRELAARVLLDAVFLVPRAGARAFKSAVAARAKRLADDGYHVTLTGPWPAYSFIEGR